MTDVAFEARLERVARRYAEAAIRPIDAAQIAAFAIRVGDRPAPRERLALPRRGLLALALVGSLLAAIVGLALLSGGGQPPTVRPSASLATGSPTPSRAETQGPAGVAEPQGGTWLADIPPTIVFDRTPRPSRMTLTVNNVDNAPEASVALVDGISGLFRSSVAGYEVEKIRFAAAGNVTGPAVTVNGSRLPDCSTGDAGDYRLSESADGLLLTLTVLTEACPSRAAILGRTWTRSLRVPNGGGAGVVDGFDPLFTVTLPPGSYVVNRDQDSTTIGQEFPEFKFESWKDPQGWNDPCDEAKGRHAIAPGADAFVAYFRQLAGFTVDGTTEMKIDGYRAVRLDVHANPDASCPAGWLNEWQPKSETSDLTWYLRPGDSDNLFIVETPSATVMFEILPVPGARGLAVIDSIHFLDRLPTAP
jgi:hypothetical protein